MGVEPKQFLQPDRDGWALLGLVVDRELVPVGAWKWVGASRSSRARNSHGSNDISASERSPAERSFSEVLSYSAGTSQSSRRAASA